MYLASCMLTRAEEAGHSAKKRACRKGRKGATNQGQDGWFGGRLEGER